MNCNIDVLCLLTHVQNAFVGCFIQSNFEVTTDGKVTEIGGLSHCSQFDVHITLVLGFWNHPIQSCVQLNVGSIQVDMDLVAQKEIFTVICKL